MAGCNSRAEGWEHPADLTVRGLGLVTSTRVGISLRETLTDEGPQAVLVEAEDALSTHEMIIPA